MRREGENVKEMKENVKKNLISEWNQRQAEFLRSVNPMDEK